MVFNGKTKLALTVTGAMALLGTAFTAGANYSRMNSHVENRQVHENASTKEERIDSRIRLHLLPINVELAQINKKIDRLLDERSKP